MRDDKDLETSLKESRSDCLAGCTNLDIKCKWRKRKLHFFKAILWLKYSIIITDFEFLWDRCLSQTELESCNDELCHEEVPMFKQSHCDKCNCASLLVQVLWEINCLATKHNTWCLQQVIRRPNYQLIRASLLLLWAFISTSQPASSLTNKHLSTNPKATHTWHHLTVGVPYLDRIRHRPGRRREQPVVGTP